MLSMGLVRKTHWLLRVWVAYQAAPTAPAPTAARRGVRAGLEAMNFMKTDMLWIFSASGEICLRRRLSERQERARVGGGRGAKDGREHPTRYLYLLPSEGIGTPRAWLVWCWRMWGEVPDCGVKSMPARRMELR